MTKEEILEYIFLCISYKHNNDISPYFIKSACEKENLLFENAIEFLDKLEKENAELKEVHESDKRSLALIAKKGADFEKAYNEAEELLDKQIEATYKLFEENKELKADNKALREKVHWWKKEVNVAHRARADEFEKLVIENKVLKRKLTYAKTIIQDLLDNTDEYARQRAEDFLKENK